VRCRWICCEVQCTRQLVHHLMKLSGARTRQHIYVRKRTSQDLCSCALGKQGAKWTACPPSCTQLEQDVRRLYAVWGDDPNERYCREYLLAQPFIRRYARW